MLGFRQTAAGSMNAIRRSYKSIYLTASGTGELGATIMNCMNETDHVLVINGGTFGQRFVDLCELHEIPHTVIKLDEGGELTAKHFAAVEGTIIYILLLLILMKLRPHSYMILIY